MNTSSVDSVFPGHGKKRWRRRDDGNRLLPEKEGLPPLKRFSGGACQRWATRGDVGNSTAFSSLAEQLENPYKPRSC
jgi:hypothetical protein